MAKTRKGPSAVAPDANASSPAPDGATRALTSFAVTMRSINDLLPYARNSRTHSDAQVAQLAASIAEFGWTNPVLADDAGIVAGHGRVLAARKLYDAGKRIALPSGVEVPDGCVPVIDCTGWSESKRRAYVIADNKLALNADWDRDVLAVELDELRDDGFDLSLLGFDTKELNDLIGTDALPPVNVDNTTIGDDRYLVIVECDTEQRQQQLFGELSTREGLSCKVMS